MMGIIMMDCPSETPDAIIVTRMIPNTAYFLPMVFLTYAMRKITAMIDVTRYTKIAYNAVLLEVTIETEMTFIVHSPPAILENPRIPKMSTNM